METIHNLTKTYEGYPSKNKTLKVGTYDECKFELETYQMIHKRNGADVIESTDTTEVVADYDNNGATVTFEIIDTHEEIFEY